MCQPLHVHVAVLFSALVLGLGAAPDDEFVFVASCNPGGEMFDAA